MASSQRTGGRGFDHEYGVTTHAILFLTDLDPQAAGDAGLHATHYEAVPVADLRAILAKLQQAFVERSTFVDIGAGMGRAMILASEHPFKQVCGLEVSPGLYEVAKENLVLAAQRRSRRCDDVRLHLADARIWNYPPGDLVAFLFNPFDALALRATLASIAGRRDPGETRLIYHTPVERAVIEESGTWRLIEEHPAFAIYVLCAEPSSSRRSRKAGLFRDSNRSEIRLSDECHATRRGKMSAGPSDDLAYRFRCARYAYAFPRTSRSFCE